MFITGDFGGWWCCGAPWSQLSLPCPVLSLRESFLSDLVWMPNERQNVEIQVPALMPGFAFPPRQVLGCAAHSADDPTGMGQAAEQGQAEQGRIWGHQQPLGMGCTAGWGLSSHLPNSSVRAVPLVCARAEPSQHSPGHTPNPSPCTTARLLL